MVYDYYYGSSPYRYSYYGGYSPRYYSSAYYHTPYYADAYYGTRYSARAYDGTLSWRGLYDADRYYTPSRTTWRTTYDERAAKDGEKGEEIKIERQEKAASASPSKTKATAAEESGDDKTAHRSATRLTWRGLYDSHYVSPSRLSWGGLYSRYHSPYYYGGYHRYGGYYGSAYRGSRYYSPSRTTTYIESSPVRSYTTYVDTSPARSYTTYRRTVTAY